MFWPACTFALVGVVAISACGPSEGDPSWLGANAALVRCTVSNKGQISRWFIEMPLPSIPSGLYARQMDPRAMHDLGYEADRPACLTLEAPEDGDIAETERTAKKFALVYRELTTNRVFFDEPCSCAAAREVQALHLIPHCRDKREARQCNPTPQVEERVRELVDPVFTAMRFLELPFEHWRLSGITDRAGWFVRHHNWLLSRHLGGSKVFTDTKKIIRHENHLLIEALLETPNVVAVVRQDAGRALLVVREIGWEKLILDYFSYPNVGSQWMPLLSDYDNTHMDKFIEALEPPAEPETSAVDPRGGNTLTIDRQRLERVDRMRVAGAPALRGPYDAEGESRSGPPDYVDRVTFQVPFGEPGTELRLKLFLSEEGRAWAQALPEGNVSAGLEGIALSRVKPKFKGAPGSSLDFMVRGNPTANALFASIHGGADLLRAIPEAGGEAVEGQIDRWSVDVPTGALPDALRSNPEFRRVRERLSQTPHRLSGRFSPERDVLELVLEPK